MPDQCHPTAPCQHINAEKDRMEAHSNKYLAMDKIQILTTKNVEKCSIKTASAFTIADV